MAAIIEISDSLLGQVSVTAQRLDMSTNRLVELALEQFLLANPAHKPENASASTRIINQGDIYWVTLEEGIPHPHVIVQDNVFNHSRMHTVVAVATTSNIKRAGLPGNVLLESGEANLPKASIVEASKLSTVNKTDLGDYIGSLNEERITQILAGMRFLQNSFYRR